jgi:hypothetical protein
MRDCQHIAHTDEESGKHIDTTTASAIVWLRSAVRTTQIHYTTAAAAITTTITTTTTTTVYRPTDECISTKQSMTLEVD